MKKRYKELQLDAEEIELLEAFESGKLKSVPNVEEEIKKAREAARASIAMRKDKNLNIRLSVHVLDRIKQKAAKSGMPYQTLIGTILHKYADGQIEIKL